MLHSLALLLLVLLTFVSDKLWSLAIQDMDYDYGMVHENIFEPGNMDKIIAFIKNKSLGRPDLRVGAMLDHWRPGSGANPEELGTYFEGDVLTSAAQSQNNSRVYIWPEATIPYQINGTFSQAQLNLILSAFNEFRTRTCIKFVPYSGTEKDYIAITSDKSGCWTSIGRTGGRQLVNLQTPGCVYYIGTILHILNHVLGFYHMHSRPDRNEHLSIQWQNIQPGSERNFEVVPAVAFSLRYDLDSIMHISSFAFSKSHEKTVLPTEVTSSIGQRNKLSVGDIAKIQVMYKCKGQESSL